MIPVTQIVAASGLVYSSCSSRKATALFARLRYSSVRPLANDGRWAASPWITSRNGQPWVACHPRFGASMSATNATAHAKYGVRNALRSLVNNRPAINAATSSPIEYFAYALSATEAASASHSRGRLLAEVRTMRIVR